MERCAMSPFIKEKKDYFVGVFDTRGRIVACHISGERPRHAGRRSSRRTRSRPCGRATSTGSTTRTSPTAPSSTTRTWSSRVPVFHEGRLVAFATTFGHYQDIGGLRAGSISPHATEIYHEGVLVPPVRIVREGQLNEEAYRIFLRNSRLPDLVEGDTRAMMASCHLAETRLGELLAPLRRRHRARRVRRVHRPDGGAGPRAVPRARAPRAVDASTTSSTATAGAEARPYRVELTLTRDGRPRAPRRLALRRPGARPHQLHDQSGAAAHRLRPLPAVARPRARRQRGPAPEPRRVGRARGQHPQAALPGAARHARQHALPRACRASSARLAQANGGRCPRARRSTSSTTSARGTRRAGAHPVHRGARRGPRRAARSPTASTSSTTSPRRTIPVEYVERDFPLRVERYAVRPDSGGPGLHRGGAGVVRDVRVLCERAELATRMENTLVAPYGVAGGRAGPDRAHHAEPRHARRARAARAWATASCSSAATSSASRPAAAAAGAIRSPATPSACARTWRAASSRARGALEDYGVVLDPVTLEVDKTATDEERGRRAAPPRPHRPRPGLRGGGGAWRAGAAPHQEAPTGRS